MFGKRRTELVIVVVLVIVIEKPLKSEDEHEDDDEWEGFTGFSKYALSSSGGTAQECFLRAWRS